MSDKLYLYPIWLRIWHAINALLFLVLVLTGISLQYSSPKLPLIRFDLAVTYHNIAGIIVSLNYLIFVLGNATTRNGSYYKIKIRGLIKELYTQTEYYLFGIFKHKPVPFPIGKNRKFNPLQKLTYVATMYLLFPIIIVTGVALLFPELIINRIGEFSGIYMTALLHGIVSFLLVIFLMIHVYFSTMGATPVSNFKSMLNGYHETH